jgi:hypothetical protein
MKFEEKMKFQFVPVTVCFVAKTSSFVVCPALSLSGKIVTTAATTCVSREENPILHHDNHYYCKKSQRRTDGWDSNRVLIKITGHRQVNICKILS